MNHIRVHFFENADKTITSDFATNSDAETNNLDNEKRPRIFEKRTSKRGEIIRSRILIRAT